MSGFNKNNPIGMKVIKATKKRNKKRKSSSLRYSAGQEGYAIRINEQAITKKSRSPNWLFEEYELISKSMTKKVRPSSSRNMFI